VPFAAGIASVDFQVLNRPTERANSLEVAYELIAYCPDLLENSIESVESLSKKLLGSEYWSFEWQ